MDAEYTIQVYKDMIYIYIERPGKVSTGWYVVSPFIMDIIKNCLRIISQMTQYMSTTGKHKNDIGRNGVNSR